MSTTNNNHEPHIPKQLNNSAHGSMQSALDQNQDQPANSVNSTADNNDLLNNILKQVDQQQELLIKLLEQNQILALEVESALANLAEPLPESLITPSTPVIEVASASHIKQKKEIAEPIQPIQNLPFLYQFKPEDSGESLYLSSEESETLRNKFNATMVAHPETALLHKMFEEIASNKPDVPAIVFHYQFLSFGELNQQANQLARYLRTRGVYEGDAIGITLPRSIDQIVAILAVLKCGCTYIPIDENETDRRLKFIVHNSDMRSVITLSDSEGKFSEIGKNLLNIISLDVEKGEISEMEAENLDILFSPQTPVHIIYSSSPIEPVGTPGFSKTILNELNWMWHNYPFAAKEICCQTAQLTRIDSVTELWSPLLQGIPNILIPDEVVVDPKLLVEFLNDIHVSRIQLPPSIVAMLLQAFPQLGDALPYLNSWFLRGEILHPELLARFKQVAQGKNIINLYSVTEAGGIVASLDTTIESDVDGICIGRPIDNTKIYILNSEGFQVDPGRAGQIIISSPGTEVGYLKNQALTKSRFAPDSLTVNSSTNRKLFRTGDYGRLTEDGKLIYLGRTDKQIKAYGNRINLDHISKVLLKQAQVKEAVISPGFNASGQLLINAYLLVGDQTYSVQNWRKFLLNQMPQYMVPTKIYQLKSTNRNSNLPLGDETMQLHAANQKTSERQRSTNPPRDEIESQLIAIWKQILSREDVNISDDFFEAGGNQILTLRLTNRIKSTFEISLEPETVFRKPTIAELAVLIREARNIRDEEDEISNAEFVESFTQKMKVISRDALVDKNKLLEIQVGISSRPRFFCVHGEDGDISFLRHWIRHLGEQPFYAFQSRTAIEGARETYKSLEDLAADYINELQKLQPRGPYHLGGYSAGGVVAYEMAQQLSKMGEEIAMLTLIDSINPAILTSPQKSFKNRFESLAIAPAGALFKRLTGRSKMAANSGANGPINHETIISPNFRGVIFEKLLNDLIAKYQIRPFAGSILLITSTDNAASENYAGIDRGWKGYALSLKIHEIPGDRQALIKEPNVKKLVGTLLRHIDAVARRAKNSERKVRKN
ncbi:MAG: AMP-binding protein [Anaerolineae bacterium]